MADLILPDNRFEAPELLYPNRKPVGNVKIDWEHPFALGLKFFVMQDSAGNIVELTKNRLVTKAGSVASSPANGISFGSNGYLTLEDSEYPIDDTTGVSQDRSLVVTDISFTTTANEVVAEKGANLHFVLQINQGTIQFRVAGSSTYNATSAVINDGLPRNCCCTYDGSLSRVYTDGKVDGVSAAISAGADDNNNFVIGSRAGSYAFSGKLRCMFIYDRCFSASQAHSITLNPYQFLIPA